MPPMGLMSVSPTERTATTASTDESATAINVSHGAMPKTAQAITAAKAVPAARPPIHQRLGIAFGSSSASPSAAGALSARTKVFQLSASVVSASLTISATPGQRIHPRGPGCVAHDRAVHPARTLHGRTE